MPGSPPGYFRRAPAARLMYRSLRIASFAMILLGGSRTQAQNTVDIMLAQVQEDQLEVRLRFANDFDGYFAASVFTIRWTDASGATLGAVQQDPQVQEYHDVGSSGGMHTDEGYRYQVFAGFGGTVLSDIPLTLPAGEWITLCRIPVVGSGQFAIVNDTFTSTVNGDFYISLSGQESQGEINNTIAALEGHTDPIEQPLVSPSVTSGAVVAEVGQAFPGLTELTLLDVRGGSCWSRRWPLGGAPAQCPIDLSALPAGTYVVRFRSFRDLRSVRVVKY